MGIKVRGPDLATIENFGIELEQYLKQVDGVKEAAVFADRIVGKPYLLLLDIDREAISHHGLSIEKVQLYIQAAVGGMEHDDDNDRRQRTLCGQRCVIPGNGEMSPKHSKTFLFPRNNGGQIPLGRTDRPFVTNRGRNPLRAKMVF